MSVESNRKAHVGKTKRDHQSGAWARSIQNKQARADWQNNHKREQGLADFPFGTCNGQEGRRWKRWLKLN